MLKPTTIETLAKLAKIDKKKLADAIAAEAETDIEITADLETFTKEELEQRDKIKEKDGEKLGRELGMKDVKKAAGLPEDAPSKDPAKLAEAIAKKATDEAKIPTDKKVQELQTQVQELIQKNTDADKALKAKDSEIAAVKFDQQILASLPADRSDVLSDDDYVTIIKNKHLKTDDDGNQYIVDSKGERFKDPKTAGVLDIGASIKGLFTERAGWLSDGNGGAGGAGGRGGKDKPPAGGGFKKRSEVVADFEARKVNIMGAEGQEQLTAELSRLSKEDPTFDMNS